MTPNEEREAARLEVIRLLKMAAERCRRVILNPPGGTDRAQSFNASRAAQQLAGLNRELQAIGARAVSVAARGIAAAYREGLEDAEQMARDALKEGSQAVEEAGVPAGTLTGGFNVVDRRRAQVLIEQTVADVHKAVISMRENTGKVVRQTQALGLNTNDVNRLLASGTLEGRPRETLRQLRELIKKYAVDGQIITVNKRTGVLMQFQAQDYADLVMQTKSAETATAATMERLQERGLYYVKVIGSNSSNFCTTFVGKVFYIGPGEDPTGQFPSSRTLPRGGPPFHVRCTKRFVAFVLDLQSQAAIKKAMLADHQRQFLGLDDRAAGKLFRAQQRDQKGSNPPERRRADDDLVSVLPARPGGRGEPIPRPRGRS